MKIDSRKEGCISFSTNNKRGRGKKSFNEPLHFYDTTCNITLQNTRNILRPFHAPSVPSVNHAPTILPPRDIPASAACFRTCPPCRRGGAILSTSKDRRRGYRNSCVSEVIGCHLTPANRLNKIVVSQHHRPNARGRGLLKCRGSTDISCLSNDAFLS